MEKYRKLFTFYHFDFDPRFPPFLLYFRWKFGVTFVRRCFRDVCLDLFLMVKIIRLISAFVVLSVPFFTYGFKTCLLS